MTRFRLVFLILLIKILPPNAFSQVQLISKTFKGTGCSASSPALISLAPDNSSFSILFTGMDVQASGPRGEKRKQCEVSIQFAIPVGQQLEYTYVEYRGFMSLSNQHAWGYVNSLAYFVNGYVISPDGSRRLSTDLSAPILRFYQPGPSADEFFWRADFNGRAQKIISTCDGKAIVRVKSEVIASIGPEGGDSAVTLDSVDGSFSHTYRISLKPCENKR